MEFMNKTTRNSLDLDYVFGMIAPRTPYGIQRKREVRPFGTNEHDKLEKEYDQTSELIDLIKNSHDSYYAVAKRLPEAKEIRHSVKRATEGMVLDEFEFFEIKGLLMLISELSQLQNSWEKVSEQIRLFKLEGVEDLLDPDGTRQRVFYIYDSYSKELDHIRSEKRDLQRRLDEQRKLLTQKVEDMLDMRLKLSGEIIILKKDEKRLANARACSDLTEGASTMLQATFKLRNNAEITSLQEMLEEIKQREGNEEYFIKKRLSKAIAENASIIYEQLDRLGKLDFFMARAEFSISIGGNRPVLHCHDQIIIKNGRHLRLEKVLAERGMKFHPASFEMHRGVTVITGANMGGKTISLKLAGQLAAIAQYGLFVPAEEFHTCLFDFIYFSIGDMQSIDSGLSTFGSEIAGMIEILRLSGCSNNETKANASKSLTEKDLVNKGLVLIDELARGTNPEEGYAISRAIVHYLKDTTSITLFTTHFDGIATEKGVRHLRVRGLRQMDYDKIQNELATGRKTNDLNGAVGSSGSIGLDAVLNNMDYSLVEVEGDYEVPKDAINIARLMGVDQGILDYAEEIMVKRKECNNG